MEFFQHYEAAVDWVVNLCPPPDKFAHTYVGLLIWVLTGIVTRRPLYMARTLLPVIGLELVNEMIDRVAHGGWMWHDTLADMAATWFWPFVLCFCLRAFPALTGHKPRPKPVLTPSAQHEIKGPLAPVPPVRATDGHDV
ncbi:hypothetical protein [Novosphingobium beihaiensis]|uniref:VanZ like protein n=1 Tax=Novosphingobium beihaiensis TaxID=2930389 RepID=A0ABT0BUV7_9SPHN|nr:hypothetical protein [Novosphingobium beihaiensis]MCJ2188723.1 hypothetical protein [Novosphingobium beihaiensis]